MRLASYSVTISLALLSSAALAQKSPGTTGDTNARPPAPAASTPEASEPAPKGYTGAYGPPGAATPYFSGPLPAIDTGPGRSIVEPDGSTKTVKAVPCGTAARETDGFTTCVGIPEKSPERRRR
jgi:hypothetical protein